MPICENIEMKYIRPYEGGYKVFIDRLDQPYVKKFPLRRYGGSANALEAARNHRDSIHKKLFGYPVSTRFFHVRKKQGLTEESEELPPGISHGYSRGKLLYIVASYCDEPGHPVRKRFNIKRLGYHEAMENARSYLKKIRADLSRN